MACVDYFEDGINITTDDLNNCAKSQNGEIKQGDFVIVRTGQMEQRLDDIEWGVMLVEMLLMFLKQFEWI